MKLTFLGADREVTGSCTQLEAAGHRFLIDCGMEQGRDVYENADLPCAPGTYEALLLTHAHIDHSGRIPYLYKNGYRGPIYTTDCDPRPLRHHAGGFRPHSGAGGRVENRQGHAQRCRDDRAGLHRRGRAERHEAVCALPL